MKMFVDVQMRLAEMFDRLLPPERRVRGNADFVTSFVPRFLQPGQQVADVGGGRFPLLSAERKRASGLRVTGLDVSASALEAAPVGCYDRLIAADITQFCGTAEHDVVICQSLLEHVRSTSAALRGLATMVRPGGKLLVFVPCRNALYARLNLLLPQNLKERLLFAIFADSRTRQGFPSFYDACTPRLMRHSAGLAGFDLVEQRLYYRSTYFAFWLPLHALWRLWQEAALRRGDPEDSVETFAMAFRRRS